MQEQSSSSQETTQEENVKTQNVGTVPTEELKPETLKPEKLTEKQKRQLRRLYVTRVNPTVKACNHKLHVDKHPMNNCVYCWQAYFYTQANIEELFGELRVLGVKKFTSKHGTKFTKNLRGFVAAELMAKKNAEKNQENKGKGWDNGGLGVEIEGQKLEVQGSPITDTKIEEVATELSLHQ